MRWSSKYGERKGDGDDVEAEKKMKKNERRSARLPPCSGNLVEKELPLVS